MKIYKDLQARIADEEWQKWLLGLDLGAYGQTPYDYDDYDEDRPNPVDTIRRESV